MNEARRFSSTTAWHDMDGACAKSRWPRVATGLALAIWLTACGDRESTPASADSAAGPGSEVASTLQTQVNASERLDELVQRYADADRAARDRSTLTDVSAAAFTAKIAAKRELLEDLQAVDSAALSAEEHIDQRALIGQLESEIHMAEARRIWENDPTLYVPARQIGRLIEVQSAEAAAGQAQSLQELLAQIPDRLQTARDNLRHPPQRFTEAALFQTRGSLDSLRNEVGPLADAAADSEAFSTALAEAVAALEAYEQYLEGDLLPQSTGSWAIGKANYDYILQHRWLMDADADEILARGRQAFADTEALAQEVSERIKPGVHWSEVYETLKDEHPPADGIKEAYQAAIDRAQAFVIENHIVTLPEGERVITVDTPPAMRRSSPFGTFQMVDPFGEDLEGRLVLTPIEDWMTPEQQAERLRSHHDAWIPIIAVHEAYPGHHVDGLKTRENPRLLRRIMREPIFSEGWGLFTEEMMFERGFLEGDDVRLTQLRNRLWRAARVILDVSLHTGQMSFEEAVDFLADKVRFERYAAELEVGMYVERPTYVLGYLIGMQEIMKIREDWIAVNGEPDPPSEFYDPLLNVGSLPPALVRESMLGTSSGKGASATGAQDAP
ncbi:DUF885 domain-containing protein [Elongatibacter sediminis]|uniref:DUF885 domain-containing protein n=1 Tax=Elongatibacter sediminis TaxID=3119006 RepID=A0AAW9RDM4_9GAMM